MRKFICITNPIKDKGRKLSKKIVEIINSLDSSIEVKTFDIDAIDATTLSGAECTMVLGGDGTLLSVAKKTIGSGCPLIGINLGDIGFLAEIERKNIKEALAKLVSGDYEIEDRMMLSGEVITEGKSKGKATALNDIVLSRSGDVQVVGYSVSVNGRYLSDFYADGIILSTPTGSTGYNMSAGGSIVEPRARLILLTPVCPHTLSTRSIVLSDSDKIEVGILPQKGRKPVRVGAYFDGYSDEVLGVGDRVVITKAKKVTKLIRIENQSFLDVLNRKMNPGI